MGERMNGVVKSLEISVENHSATCAGKLASLLGEERGLWQEVLQAEAASRTRELKEGTTSLKERSPLTNLINHEASTCMNTLAHHIQNVGSGKNYNEKAPAGH